MTSRRRRITDGNQPCSMLTGSSPDKFSSPSPVIPFHDCLSSVHAMAAAALQGVREGRDVATPHFEGLHARSSEQRVTRRPRDPCRQTVSHHQGALLTSITHRPKPTRDFWWRLTVQMMQESWRSMKGEGRNWGSGGLISSEDRKRDLMSEILRLKEACGYFSSSVCGGDEGNERLEVTQQSEEVQKMQNSRYKCILKVSWR